jgi:hypothetical protein
MTRFDADDPGARRKLFAEAITAHRTRASRCVTFEADTDTDPVTDLDGGEGGDDAPRPWVQFGDNTFNLDVTDDELADLKDLIGEFPEFRGGGNQRPRHRSVGSEPACGVRGSGVSRRLRPVEGLPGLGRRGLRSGGR